MNLKKDYRFDFDCSFNPNFDKSYVLELIKKHGAELSHCEKHTFIILIPDSFNPFYFCVDLYGLGEEDLKHGYDI